MNIWQDVQEVMKLSNLVYQTTRKITVTAFSKMQVSILYRLISWRDHCGPKGHADTSLVVSRSLKLWMLMILRTAVPAGIPDGWERDIVRKALHKQDADMWHE